VTEVIAGVATTVISAVAGAITLTGFVTFVGGAVFWTRFEAVGIPYDHAVAVVEPKQLVVVGASLLAVFLMTAILAVLLRRRRRRIDRSGRRAAPDSALPPVSDAPGNAHPGRPE
jgi:hypothetical protein